MFTNGFCLDHDKYNMQTRAGLKEKPLVARLVVLKSFRL